MLLFEIIILFIINKEESSKKLAFALIPLLVSVSIIANIYIFNSGIELNKTFNKLRQGAEKGYFYLKDADNLFGKEFKPYGMGGTEQISYSIIAVNSKKNRNLTKGMIFSYNDFFNIINYCNNKVHATGGALDINFSTTFWDLTPYKEHFIENCN